MKNVFFMAALSLCPIPHLPPRKADPSNGNGLGLTAPGSCEGLNPNILPRQRDSWLSSELIHLLNGNVKAWQTVSHIKIDFADEAGGLSVSWEKV